MEDTSRNEHVSIEQSRMIQGHDVTGSFPSSGNRRVLAEVNAWAEETASAYRNVGWFPVRKSAKS